MSAWEWEQLGGSQRRWHWFIQWLLSEHILCAEHLLCAKLGIQRGLAIHCVISAQVGDRLASRQHPCVSDHLLRFGQPALILAASWALDWVLCPVIPFS